jgi:hypothetical protein
MVVDKVHEQVLAREMRPGADECHRVLQLIAATVAPNHHDPQGHSKE